jgi:hypothetical protein
MKPESAVVPTDLDTVSALKSALQRAAAGNTTGVLVIEFDATGYEVTIAGTPRTSKTYALGALAIAARQIKRALDSEPEGYKAPTAAKRPAVQNLRPSSGRLDRA